MLNRRNLLAASLTGCGLAMGSAALAEEQINPKKVPVGSIGLRFGIKQNRIFLPVRVNDEGPFSFLIDTGTENYMLSQQLAKKLGIKRQSTVSISGRVGRMDLPQYTAASLLIGEQLIKLGPTLIGQPDGRFDLGEGSIPSDDVANFNFDFDAMIAHMSTPVMRLPKGFESFRFIRTNPVAWSHLRSGNRPMIVAQYDGKPIRLLVDTGVPDGLFLLPSYVKRNHLWDRYPRYASGQLWTTIADVTPVRQVIGAPLKLGSIVFKDPPVSLGDPAFSADTGRFSGKFDASRPDADTGQPVEYLAVNGEQIDGAIGVELLKRMNLITDMSRQEVYLKANNAFDDDFRVDRSGMFPKVEDGVVRIVDVRPGSPAAAKDFRVGDVISGWRGEGGYFAMMWALKGHDGANEYFQITRGGETIEKGLTLSDWL